METGIERDRLGIAVDIGTTTVALYLVDMEKGEKLETAGGMNAQAPHGADVTGRITYCMEHGHEELTRLIRGQIDEMLAGTGCGSLSGINQMVIAGNTVMQHLAAGYSPVSMGTSPYTPLSLFGEILPGWDTLPLGEKAGIYYTPAISAYVGGDITAGLLAAGFEEIDGTSLFIDVGTNGEIALKHGGKYYCAAAAAGPAFEGAEIAMGMAAIPGAIDHVWKKDGDKGSLEYSVIGGGPPRGLCGSGLLDLLAALLDMGVVDGTGRLAGSGKYVVSGGGMGFIHLPDTADVYITASDIRKLQLAKAAIAGGIRVLMHYAGVCETDIKLLALAGGFGSYLNTQSAARVGLFPKALQHAAKAYGNTAGEGAVMALCSEHARTKLENIRRKCEYIELSSNAFFNDKFIEEMAMS